MITRETLLHQPKISLGWLDDSMKVVRSLRHRPPIRLALDLADLAAHSPVADVWPHGGKPVLPIGHRVLERHYGRTRAGSRLGFNVTDELENIFVIGLNKQRLQLV